MICCKNRNHLVIPNSCFWGWAFLKSCSTVSLAHWINPRTSLSTSRRTPIRFSWWLRPNYWINIRRLHSTLNLWSQLRISSWSNSYLPFNVAPLLTLFRPYSYPVISVSRCVCNPSLMDTISFKEIIHLINVPHFVIPRVVLSSKLTRINILGES